MKCRRTKVNANQAVLKTEKQIRTICEAHVTERYDEITHNAAYQSMAVTFYILSRDFGFGKQRLAKLKDAIEDEFALMDVGILGRDYNANHVCAHLKEKYDIDFGESHLTRRNDNADK